MKIRNVIIVLLLIALMSNIFGASVLQEFQITTDTSSQTHPAIYENIVVWEDGRNRYDDIFGYDMGPDGIFGTPDDIGEFQITTDTEVRGYPVIYENIVVWEDFRNRNWDIYGYDMGPDGIFGTPDDIGEFQITTDTTDQAIPAIYENIVVWYDSRNGHLNIYGNLDIYGYDMGPDGIFGTPDDIGEFQITTDTKNQRFPAIYENIVVWYDRRSGNWDIYGYDMGPDGIFGTPDDIGEFQITTDTREQSFPRIYENVVVWQDFRNGYGDIYGSKIIIEPSRPILPGIHSTFTLQNDVVEMYIRVVDDTYSSVIYNIEIFPEIQQPVWYSVEAIEAPPGWSFEKIGDGVRFYTEKNPLLTCQRTKFIIKVRAERISWYMKIHVTDQNHQDMGMIISTRWWLCHYWLV